MPSDERVPTNVLKFDEDEEELKKNPSIDMQIPTATTTIVV